MNKEKRRSLYLKLTILLSGGVMMADLAVYPAAEKIFEAFPKTNTGLLNFILTGPSLILIFSSVLCGVMAQYIGKKALISGAYVLFTLSSLACVFADAPALLAVMRALMGVAMGFIGTAMVGLIAELYMDENARSSVLGYYNGIMAGMGALFSLGAGYLALKNWQFVFLVFLVMIPVTLAVIAFIPQTEPEGKKDSRGASRESVPYKNVLALAGAAFVVNAMYAVILTQVAVIVTELGIGNASTAGVMGSLGTIGSLCACLAFGRIYDKCKNFIPVIFTIVMALGYTGLFFSRNILLVGLMCGILGAMYGLSFSYYLMYASVIVPPSKASLSISIANAAVYLGIFAGPYVPLVYQRVFSRSTIVDVLPYMIGTLAVCGTISAVLSVRRKHTLT